MHNDPPQGDPQDEFGNMLDDASIALPNPYEDKCSARRRYVHAWLSKLLVFVFYFCFSPIPSSGGIGPLAGLWFDTMFLKKPNINRQIVSSSK